MDAEERALLAAIAANPDEDTPRLVYADWLQEHDRPEQAEFIRLDIQLSNLRYGDPNFEADERRLTEQFRPVFARFFPTWPGEFAEHLPTDGSVRYHLERGAVGGLCCPVQFFLDNADALFRAAPIRAYMPYSLTPATAEQLVRSPPFRRLKKLHVHEVEYAPALLACKSVQIDMLDFSQFRLSPHSEWDAFAVALAGHRGLKLVKRIDFENRGLGDAAGEALAASTRLEPDVLNLLTNDFSEPVRAALRKRYGPRVWLAPTDRSGFLRRRV